MKKNKLILLLTILLSYSTFGQLRTEVEKVKLFGKVKSILSYKVEYGEKTDTVLIKKEYYNENGMKLKYINFSEHSRFDSIVNTFDNKNRRTSKIEFKRTGSFGNIGKEKIIDTLYYEYNNKCNDPIIIKDPKGTYKVITKLDENCNIISETVIDYGRENSTTFELDKKGRVIKKVVSNLGEKADLYETFEYDDENNTSTNIQYSPKHNVYYLKKLTQFNENKKVVQVTNFQQVIMKDNIFVTSESQNVPDNIYKKVKYEYDGNNKLISELSFDGKNNELEKVENFYDETGKLKEEKHYQSGKLEIRREYKYENGKRVEEKTFLQNNKTPEFVKTQRYNDNGQIIEFMQLADGDKYSNQYVYDSFNNEIENKEHENGKLLRTKFTKIEYHP